MFVVQVIAVSASLKDVCITLYPNIFLYATGMFSVAKFYNYRYIFIRIGIIKCVMLVYESSLKVSKK